MPESQSTPEPLPGDNDPFSDYIQDHLDVDRLDEDEDVELLRDDEAADNPLIARFRSSSLPPFGTTPPRPPSPSPFGPSGRFGFRAHPPEPTLREELGALPLALMLSRLLRNLYLLLILGFLLIVLLQLLTTAGTRNPSEADDLRATISASEAQVQALQATLEALQTSTPAP